MRNTMTSLILSLLMVLSSIGLLEAAETMPPEQGKQLSSMDFLLKTAIASDKAQAAGLIWVAAPEFTYNIIHYCQSCDMLGNNFDSSESKKSRLLDVKAKLHWLINSEFKDEKDTLYICSGHGSGSPRFMYDDHKKLFGYHYVDESNDNFVMKPLSIFFKDKEYINRPFAFVKIDSGKVKKVKNEEFGPGGDIIHKFDDAYINKKYAIACNGKFVTDFIYDDYDTNSIFDTIAVKINNKWGIIDNNASTLVPFELDHITFIDKNSALAKYNGKYGVLAVPRRK